MASAPQISPVEMRQITLTIHGKLNDFLPNHTIDNSVQVRFNQKTALKHIVEVIGVPHPEVGLVEVDGHEAGLNYPVQDGDIIHIYPKVVVAQQFNPGGPKFVLDNHLGKLTEYLRLLGLDAVYAQDWPDEDIAQYAHDQGCILLTRDRGLLKRKIVADGYCVRADDPEKQLAEVVSQYHLNSFITPFQRCPRCNGKLSPVRKEDIIEQLLPLTRKYYDEFTRCTACGQIYWKGSHYQHMQTMLSPYLNQHLEEQ